MADKQKQGKRSAMEQLLGPSLLTTVDTTKPTDQVLKGKPLVALYFSASWCSPCKAFTPVLAEFYKLQSKDIEIVYLSSDHRAEDFAGYFGKMPWVAQPMNKESALLKKELSNKCNVVGIPALIVLETKTGNVITYLAKNRVTSAMQSKTTAVLVEEWKQTEAVPLGEATSMGGTDSLTLWGFFSMMMRNPTTLIAIFYLIKQLLKYLAPNLGMKAGDGEL